MLLPRIRPVVDLQGWSDIHDVRHAHGPPQAVKKEKNAVRRRGGVDG